MFLFSFLFRNETPSLMIPACLLLLLLLLLLLSPLCFMGLQTMTGAGKAGRAGGRGRRGGGREACSSRLAQLWVKEGAHMPCSAFSQFVSVRSCFAQ
jgi:hypothetical protein